MKKIFSIMIGFSILILSIGCANQSGTTTEDLIETSDIIVSVSLGDNFSSVVTDDGQIYTWGINADGQLGDGTIFNSQTPVNITSKFALNEDEQIIQVSLGYRHSGALTNMGRVFAWGDNTYGQVGDGTYPDRALPADITPRFSLNEGEKILSISFGYDYSSAFTSQARVFMWGNNDFGKLGNGNTESGRRPIDITSQFSLEEGEQIQSVSLGAQFSTAITSEHRVFTWGMNTSGQLGDGTQTNQYIPVDITSMFQLNQGEYVTYLSPGGSCSIATTSQGRVFAWGSNSDGQLGDGTETDRLSPVDITSQFELGDNETVVSASFGTFVSAVVTSESRVFIWGNNGTGQLGNNSTSGIFSSPQDQTSNFSLNEQEQITHVYFRASHASALTNEGNLFIWGGNSSGQLGDGTTDSNAQPLKLDLK